MIHSERGFPKTFRGEIADHAEIAFQALDVLLEGCRCQAIGSVIMTEVATTENLVQENLATLFVLRCNHIFLF